LWRGASVDVGTNGGDLYKEYFLTLSRIETLFPIQIQLRMMRIIHDISVKLVKKFRLIRKGLKVKK